MIKKTCESCKYWRKYQEAFSTKSFMICEGFDEAGSLENVPHNSAEVYVIAHDDTGLDWLFLTGKDFSCSNYKVVKLEAFPAPIQEVSDE